MGTSGKSSWARRVSSFCFKTSNKQTDGILLSVGEHLDSSGQCKDERKGRCGCTGPFMDTGSSSTAGAGSGNTAEMFLCSGQLVKSHLPHFAEFFPPSTGRP